MLYIYIIKTQKMLEANIDERRNNEPSTLKQKME